MALLIIQEVDQACSQIDGRVKDRKGKSHPATHSLRLDVTQYHFVLFCSDNKPQAQPDWREKLTPPQKAMLCHEVVCIQGREKVTFAVYQHSHTYLLIPTSASPTS